jgi:hypothetical protein
VFQQESFDPLSFGSRKKNLIGLCGAIESISSSLGLGGRSLEEAEEEKEKDNSKAEAVQCLCSPTFAHQDCCQGGKLAQAVLDT